MRHRDCPALPLPSPPSSARAVNVPGCGLVMKPNHSRHRLTREYPFSYQERRPEPKGVISGDVEIGPSDDVGGHVESGAAHCGGGQVLLGRSRGEAHNLIQPGQDRCCDNNQLFTCRTAGALVVEKLTRVAQKRPSTCTCVERQW